jgi:chain length determinant protein tyrosine kinase EpsG
MGEILVDLGKLGQDDVDRVIVYQQEKGLYFGEAAVGLGLVTQDDILHALSTQFGYTYSTVLSILSKKLTMAHSPFGKQAEEFRAIRGQLLSGLLKQGQKTLAVVSPGTREGRSYVAANLALAFSQSGYSTLLIDADMRAPQQHELFSIKRRIGFSMLLAGRVRIEDLDALPDQISTFQNLSVLGCGAVPPNPAELLNRKTFSRIMRELKKYFDIIVLDTPPATYQADVISIASVAESSLLVTRSGHSKMESVKHLMSLLAQAECNVVGSVLNQY